jgi:hypothetical protein
VDPIAASLPGVEGFDAWVTYQFARPAGVDRATWDEQPVQWLNAPVAAAERIRHLFGNAESLLRPYSDDQVARGLVDLIAGGDLALVSYRKLPTVLYTSTIRSVVTLFREIFAARITSEDPQQRPELESLCFMFFDMAAIDLGDDTVLDVLEDTLALESAACQRSALHGLGHAHFHVPQHAASIVDRWLQRHPRAPAELRDYALAARTGNVM